MNKFVNARVVAKKGVALFYSGKVGEFTIFLCETSSGFNIIKILINIIKISSIYSKSIKGGGVFLIQCILE